MAGMKTWLATPATRAEVIGWAIGVCSLYGMLLVGIIMPQWLAATGLVVRAHPDLASPVLNLYFDIGPNGFRIVFALCALLTLLALVTKQPPWVRIAAPIVCLLLSYSIQRQFNTSFIEFSATLQALDGDR